MGNRNNESLPPIEQSMQCDARTGVYKQSRLQAEGYPEKVAERVSQGQQMVARELTNLMSRLQNAQETFSQNGMRAAIPEYMAAIRTADSIDQKAVAKERENIKELLKDKSLDAKTRRLLLQEDADLHTLQRAPGFARANFALLTIRSGDQFNGTQLLVEAQKKDYEMSKDPNFQRHLKYAIDDKNNAPPREKFTQYQPVQQRIAGEFPPPGVDPRLSAYAPQVDPRFSAPKPDSHLSAYPPGMDPRLSAYAPQVDPRFLAPKPDSHLSAYPPGMDPRLSAYAPPGDPRLAAQPPGYQPPYEIKAPAPQQFAPGDPRLQPQPVPQQFAPGDPRLRAQPVQPQLPSDVAPLQRQSTQPDVTPLRLPVGRFSPMDAQGRSPVESAQALFASVTGPKTMTPEVKQQFQLAIKNADTGVSPKLAFLQQQETLAANALKPLMAPDIAKVMVGFDQAVNNACQQMAPDKRQAAVQLYNAIDKAPNLAERQQVQTQLIQLNPALKDVLDKREQYLGPQNVQLLLNYNGFKNAVASEKNQVAITRFMFGLALSKNGDANEAKLQIAQALKLNRDPDLTNFWKNTAAQLGIPSDKAPQPVPGAIQPTVPGRIQPLAPGVPGRAGDARPPIPGVPGQPGDTRPPVPGVIQPPVRAGADLGKPPGVPSDVRGAQPDAATILRGVSPENQGMRPEQIFAKARQSLEHVGMTDATKKQFEDSIKVADSLFTPAEKEVADKLLAALKSGRKFDGSVLQPQERMRAHAFIQNEVQQSVSGVAMRMAYAELLAQHKQYATADKILKDATAASDRLPFAVYSAELDQLNADMKNPNFTRADNADLLKMSQTLRGVGNSKEDGLIYLPMLVRKQAAEFYLSGRDGQPGVLQAERAVAVIDEAKNLAKSLYRTDLDSNPNWDTRLVSLAKESSKYLPENLKKEKAKADTFWSNALIDGGTAAAVFVAAGFAASAITRNPVFARLGLSTGEGAITFGGKAALVSSALLSATATRHYAHSLITGDNESWTKSAIHGTAGVAGVAAIIGTRGKVNQFLFRGATEEAMWIKAAGVRGTAVPVAEGASATSRILTAGDAAAICTEQGIKLTQKAKDFLAIEGNSAKILVQDGVIADAAAYDAMKLGLNPAQATSLARAFMPLTTPAAAVEKMPSFKASLGEWWKNANPVTPLDLATTTTTQMRFRGFYSGYTSAFAGLGTYNTITALDRSVNPTTGKINSFGEQFMDNNFRSKFDNTPVNALLVGLIPVLQDGGITRSMVAADAGAAKSGITFAKTSFLPNGMGAIGEGATYIDRGRQAAYIGAASTVWDPGKIRRFFDGRDQAWMVGRNLDATKVPMQDAAVTASQK
ncbi:MAG: hypothetical protein JST89_15600 [Cyanobacteria bacterium SZAS-4]|nr:hypothetical protein [Cyanobacteria bacterium SZAS-4]